MNKKELDSILENHKKWLNNEDVGICANLSYANLSYADLRYANLRDADLSYANLSCADLRGADLRCANLRGADLRGASLRDANLSDANLCYADLRDADLRDANLSDANYASLQCPENGSFIAWKKCRDNIIVKLLIPSDAKRSSATSRKCRADKAVVVDISGAEKAISKHDINCIYIIGETISVDNFDDNRWNECSTGIHFFITRKEAEEY